MRTSFFFEIGIVYQNDLRKHSIKYTGGRSRKKHEDSPEGMCEEVDDSGRGESGMQRLELMRSVWRSVLSNYPARDKA